MGVVNSFTTNFNYDAQGKRPAARQWKYSWYVYRENEFLRSRPAGEHATT